MKNARFYLCAGLALVADFAAVAAMPYVTDVSLAAGAGSREATVTYVLHGAPAVIALPYVMRPVLSPRLYAAAPVPASLPGGTAQLNDYKGNLNADKRRGE